MVPLCHMYSSESQNHRRNVCTLCSVYIHNIVQMSLGHPVTLSLNHPVLVAWQQVSVGGSIECFEYTGIPMSSLAVGV